jgi:hypothetical protein
MHFAGLEASALFSFLATKIKGAKSGSAQLSSVFFCRRLKNKPKFRIAHSKSQDDILNCS